MLLLFLAFSKPLKSNITSKEEALALAVVKALVSRFEEKMPSYKKNYSETQTRIDLIDPFFEALDWDINNKKRFSKAYRDVIHEEKIKIGKATKAKFYNWLYLKHCFIIQYNIIYNCELLFSIFKLKHL